MRSQFMRATSWTVLGLLLGSAGSGFAQEASGTYPRAATARVSLPDGADEAALAHIIELPDLPMVAVDLAESVDVTGSIDAPKMGNASPPVEAVPPLSFDDEPKGPSPLAGLMPPSEPDPMPVSSVPPMPAEAAPAVASEPPATPSPVAVTAPAAAPAPIAVAPAAPPSPAVQPTPADVPAVAANPGVPGGLDGASLSAALAGFADETLSTESPAQAAERKTQRQAIVAFYGTRANAPLWIGDGRLTPAARSVLARLDHATEDGLDLGRFVVPVPRDGETATLARAELALSEAALAYARQASGSRINVARFGGTIDLRPDVADAMRVLGSVPAAADAGEALRAFNPPQPGYAALRDKLAETRQSAGAVAQGRIPYGPVLKPGMIDARVPLIRARFGLDVAADDPTATPLVYDTKVAAAVAAFQRAHHMPASGLLTARTIAVLSGGNPANLENDILANMELWRWMPRDMAPDRIEVNIPAFQARVLREGVVMHETRVVVGQPDKPTPVFTEQMRFIIVNPYWNVPLSIIKNEMMPKLASDPNYFANHGYEVVERNGTTYVRQPPGEGNALGRIKFMFPNSHSVYLHDTNARSYFSRDMRALSHGCVRVEEPFSFAEAVMGRDNGWSEERIKKLIGGKERTINLPKPLPILITYFTAFVDKEDGFQLRPDVYGYAARVKAALGLQG